MGKDGVSPTFPSVRTTPLPTERESSNREKSTRPCAPKRPAKRKKTKQERRKSFFIDSVIMWKQILKKKSTPQNACYGASAAYPSVQKRA
jgi:hypothetical protein